MDGILQVEMPGHGGGIGGVVIHVVTFGYLRRAAMSATVVGDHAKPLTDEKQHLGIPVV